MESFPIGCWSSSGLRWTLGARPQASRQLPRDGSHKLKGAQNETAQGAPTKGGGMNPSDSIRIERALCGVLSDLTILLGCSSGSVGGKSRT